MFGWVDPEYSEYKIEERNINQPSLLECYIIIIS